MSLTEEAVAHFEEEQHRYGTNVALSNFVWVIAADLLKSIGVTHLDTAYGWDRE